MPIGSKLPIRARTGSETNNLI